MKKIIYIFLVLCLFGCSNNKEEKIVKEVKVKNNIKKSYYVSLVSYVDHSDFYNTLKDDNEKKLLTKNIDKVDVLPNEESNNLELTEENENITVELSYEKEENNENNDVMVENNSNENEPNNILEEDNLVEKDTDISLLNNDLKLKESIEEIKESISFSNEMVIEEPGVKIDTEETNIIVNNEYMVAEAPVKEIGYYSPSGKYLGVDKVKVIDVSYYQGIINWDLFASESDCYGVILRLGYYDTLDKKFEKNISELKRLNIPYGIYLFSYATTLNGALKEANFTNNMIDYYELEPTLGIYYDIESWSTKTSSSNNITKDRYDEIVQLYINAVSSHISYKYKVKVYSGRWYAMNRLGYISKSYVDWVAEYNSTCKYDGNYSLWQYTSKGSVPGINGNVDISYIIN